jgi:hypothetical protein
LWPLSVIARIMPVRRRSIIIPPMINFILNFRLSFSSLSGLVFVGSPLAFFLAGSLVVRNVLVYSEPSLSYPLYFWMRWLCISASPLFLSWRGVLKPYPSFSKSIRGDFFKLILNIIYNEIIGS